MTTVIAATPEWMRLNDGNTGLCTMCPAPATLRIMHRCGSRGGDSCAKCWRQHLRRCRALIDQYPDRLGTCRYCCDPDDETQVVGLDHVYAEPLHPSGRIRNLDFEL